MVRGQVAFVRRVLAHGGDPEAVVEGLTAESEGLEEPWDGRWAEFRRLVIVGGRACQDCAGWRVLDRGEPWQIGFSDVIGRVGHASR